MRPALRFIRVFWLPLMGNLLFALPHSAAAEFPYKAETTADNVAVHSGPGSRYYLTGELKKNAQVEVHRHDPGGWYMISPPSDNFSLIRAEHISKDAGGFGVVSENNVVVRVGSSLGDRHEVEQRRLMKGDRVKILGEESIEERGRVIKMLKIEPPQGEFRWVKGDLLIPVDLNLRKKHDANPFAFPSNGIHFEPDTNPSQTPDLRYPVAEEPKTTPVEHKPEQSAELPSWVHPATDGVATNVDLKKLERDRNILNALDQNFQQMLRQDVSEWKFNDLQHDYQKLKSSTSVEAIASQIDLRLKTMQKYLEIQGEFDSLRELTAATNRRDTALAEAQSTPVSTAMTFGTEVEYSSEFGPIASLPGESAGFLPDLGPGPEMGMFPSAPETAQFPEVDQTAMIPQDVPQITPVDPPLAPLLPVDPRMPHHEQHAGHLQHPHAPGAPQQIPQQGFVGAGILQPLPPQPGRMPEFALVNQQGQMLAVVTTPQPQILQPYVGRAVGIYGSRQQSPATGQDVIAATGAAPVYLR